MRGLESRAPSFSGRRSSALRRRRVVFVQEHARLSAIRRRLPRHLSRRTCTLEEMNHESRERHLPESAPTSRARAGGAQCDASTPEHGLRQACRFPRLSSYACAFVSDFSRSLHAADPLIPEAIGLFRSPKFMDAPGLCLARSSMRSAACFCASASTSSWLNVTGWRVPSSSV